MHSNSMDDSYPVMFIDPVYATVTSKTSNLGLEFANEQWKDNSSGLSGGIIQFLSQGNNPKKPNVSYFVKMSEDTNTSMIADYMDKTWRFRSPNIILSVISSPDHWKPWMNPKQKEDFQKGIIKAVNTTTMWLMTNGKNSGVCKLIGDAIKMEKDRRQLLANNYSRNIITTTKLEKLPKITAIGIVQISQLTYANDFESEGTGVTIDLKNQGNMTMSASVELNPDMTNFIMLDGIKHQKELDTRRLSLEERFRKPVGKPKEYAKLSDMNNGSVDELETIKSTNTPLVVLLIQGSPLDIEHVCDLIKMKVPVIVVKGTGSAADLFSFAYDEICQRADLKGTDVALKKQRNGCSVEKNKRNRCSVEKNKRNRCSVDQHLAMNSTQTSARGCLELAMRSEEEHLNSYLKPELLKRIQKTFPDDFQNDVLSRNKCRDMIIECVQLSIKANQNFMIILDPETDPSGLENLDRYMLHALFESQEPKKGRQIQEQIQNNLKLTLDWNMSDLALSKIFQKYDWMSIKISKDLFDLALTKRDRHKFVGLFLDQQAIELNRYFNFRKLKYLINHYEDPEFFRTICLGEILDYSPISDYPVKKKFVYGERCALNVLLFKTTYLSNLVSVDDFDKDDMEEDIISPAVAERKAINVLVFWAALNFDAELTKTLWKKTEEPMAMAFIVSMIWHSIAKQWCPDPDTKKKLLASAKEFGGLAVKLLQHSYQDSNLNTIAFLDKRLEDFNNKTIIELAHIAKNKHFIAHSVCQKWLNRRWAGNLLFRKLDWGPVKIPNWAKIYLSLVFVFPMFMWITYDLADKQRRDKILEDDNDDYTLLDEPMITKERSLFADKWINNAGQTIAYKMRSVWNSGKERFRVPIHLQFYYLWSAPITKFWLSQWFYILFLVLFSVATLHPNCGMIYLDLAVFGWLLMIWIEQVRSTISKKKKYKELDLFWTVIEIFVMAAILLVIFALRMTPYFVTYFMYPTTKFVMSLGLLYFYYRTLFVFIPISPVLGPMLISIRRMITHDFLTWFRMFLIIMVSGAVTIHAVLYPNYPLVFNSVKQSLARALFAMFLTKIDDLEGDPTCSYMYKNTSVSRCYSLPQGSFYSDNYNHYTKVNLTSEEREYRQFAKCPYSSLGGYFIVIQYLLIVKLIMVTLLYALFSNTNAKVQGEAEDIWKFQKYSLIVDFEEKLILPPPFNCISYVVMIIQEICYCIKYCYRRCRKDCRCCKKKHDFTEGAHKLSAIMLHTTDVPSYWNGFVKKLDQDEKQEQIDRDQTKIQSQILLSLKNQLGEQRQFNGRLVKQISCLEQNVTSCEVALETLQHMMEKLNPHLQPTVVSSDNFIHVLSRQSPYPKTNVQRFPVFTKYVLWEIRYGVYDPSVYTQPTEKYPEHMQPYVDVDYLRSILKSKVVSLSQEDLRDITLELGNIMPVWNTTSNVTINGVERTVNRTSFIKKCGVPIQYQIDSCNLPMNPKGRTGLRGKGRLIRWGPNHNVMVVITRWKKKENSQEFMVIDGKKVLEVIAIKESENVESKLPRGGDVGYMTMYSALCKKILTYTRKNTNTDINPDMTEFDMIKFFRQLSPLPGPDTPFTTNIIYKGYFDDRSNTDNAWREVEVWNFHFEEGDGDLSLKDKEKKWKTVSSYNTFHGSQDLILRQAATLHNAYY